VVGVDLEVIFFGDGFGFRMAGAGRAFCDGEGGGCRQEGEDGGEETHGDVIALALVGLGLALFLLVA
jgi:hypothetical protein